MLWLPRGPGAGGAQPRRSGACGSLRALPGRSCSQEVFNGKPRLGSGSPALPELWQGPRAFGECPLATERVLKYCLKHALPQIKVLQLWRGRQILKNTTLRASLIKCKHHLLCWEMCCQSVPTPSPEGGGSTARRGNRRGQKPSRCCLGVCRDSKHGCDPVGAPGLLALPAAPAGLSSHTASEHLALPGPSREEPAPHRLSQCLRSLAVQGTWPHFQEMPCRDALLWPWARHRTEVV